MGQKIVLKKNCFLKCSFTQVFKNKKEFYDSIYLVLSRIFNKV